MESMTEMNHNKSNNQERTKYGTSRSHFEVPTSTNVPGSFPLVKGDMVLCLWWSIPTIDWAATGRDANVSRFLLITMSTL